MQQGIAPMSHHIPATKATATALGLALCASETWLNVEAVAHVEGWMSSLVAATAIASIAAAAALPMAERAAKSGHITKAFGLILFFIVMAGFAFTTSTARVGGKHDGEVAATQGDNTRAKLAADAYAAAQKVEKAECEKGRTSRCRKAEKATAEARTKLAAAPTEKTEDSMAVRVAAILPISADTVQTYQPLLLPTAFLLGGFLFLALGLAPRKRQPANRMDQEPEQPAPAEISSEAAAYQWMLDRLLAAPGRQLTASGRELATMAGVAPATFAKWQRRWIEDGKIVTVRAGNKTCFSLPRLRSVG
jgi:hypothetical protein